MNGAPPEGRVGWRGAALVMVVALGVYWPRLGAGGLTASEGHRVVPAWEMLASGGWLLPRMFGQVYLRKPPGIFWAIAGSGWVFGETEWAARAVSAAAATGLAALAYALASRWFGRPWGVAAGLAQALMPLMWMPGRSAEIEALNTLAIVAACLLLIDLMIPREGRGRGAEVGLACGAAVALVVAALMKGPVVLPFVAGAMAGACVVLGSARPLMRPAVVGATAAAAGVAGLLWMLISRAVEASGEAALVQGVDEFTWGSRALTFGSVMEVAVFGPAVLLSGLPATLALVFVPWRRGDGGEDRGTRLARAVALGCLISLGVLTAMGVSNPRYGMPAAAITPVLVGFAVRRIAGGAVGGCRGRIGDALRLKRPAWIAGVLGVGAAAWIFVLEPQTRAKSGRDAGVALAAALPDGAEVWADHLIAARPEVLLYAQREAARAGRSLGVRWGVVSPGGAIDAPGGAYLALRTDEMSGEDETHRRAGALAGAVRVHEGTVHKYTFAVYRRGGGTGVSPVGSP